MLFANAMSSDEIAIRNLIGRWIRATEAGDTEALAPLMADDMVFLAPGREPFGKREFLEGSSHPASKAKISIQADVQELRISGDLAYCWLKLAVSVILPGSSTPTLRSGHTIGIYRREADGWVLARDANLVL